MTLQVDDSIIYEGNEYDFLLGYDDKPFVPEEYGLNPTVRITACYRGFISKYIIKNSKLYLDELTISCMNDEYPSLNGILPSDANSIFGNIYKNINLFIPFTGTVVAANELLNTSAMYRPTHFYKNVLEMQFDEGSLISVNDVSRKYKKIREQEQKNQYI